MKEIINYKESLEIFRKYILDKNNISEDSIKKLYQAFQGVKEVQDLDLKELFNIENEDDIKNKIFFMQSNEIKKIAKKLKRNKQYIGALEVAKKYAKLKKEEEKQNFDFQNFAQDTITNLSTIIKTFERYYNKFTSSKNKSIVYSIIDKLETRACPYCNLNYIDVIRNEDGTILRPALDHFYPKSKYPFFALSFFNLVPTCYECNSSLKRDKDEKDLLNPFNDDFDNLAKFTLSLSGGGQLNHALSDISSFNIELNSRTKNNKGIVNKQNECFALNERYRYRKEEASEILSKCILDTPEFRKEIKKVFPTVSEQYIEKLIYGNSLSCEEINKRPLAKMTCDLVDFYKTSVKKDDR